MAAELKIDAAEKAYAAAAAEVKSAKLATATASKPAAPAKGKAAKAAAPKTGKKNKPAAAEIMPVPAQIKAKIARKAAAPAAVVETKPMLNVSKDKIMTQTTDFAQPIADVFGEYQNRAKAAYEKGTATLTEATEFAKGNVEAIVESGKILAGGIQGLGKSYVEEAKSAYETMTADVKELAAVKSPTELFQLQGKIARRNFDALVATSSKTSDAFIKLATEAFAPITGRANLAVEKLATAA